MPEIGTSGLMSGDGKRGDGLRPPSYRAHPRLYRSRNRILLKLWFGNVWSLCVPHGFDGKLDE